MFLEQTIKENPDMTETALHLHRTGVLLSDSFVADVDTLMENVEDMLEMAKGADVRLYFIPKQLERDPYTVRELVEAGYEGMVVVDYKEAGIMTKAGIPISNIGHLVRVPNAQLGQVTTYDLEVITVFSKEKVKAIDEEAGKPDRVQGLLTHVFNEEDMIHSGQATGLSLENPRETTEYIRQECPHVKVKDVASFPYYLYDEGQKRIGPTENLRTVLEGTALLEEVGVSCEIINTPPTTCGYTIDLVKQYGRNYGGSDHGLTGTTPIRAVEDTAERPCVLYTSEVSRNLKGIAHRYDGGHYRRSYVSEALVGPDWSHGRMMDIIPSSDENIDYYFGFNENCQVGDIVIMTFRYQAFVTRNDVALVEDLQSGEPEITGTYDSLGRQG